MAFSGGTFSRTFDCTTDRDNGVKILASKFDTELDGFATGLSTCILKDGTQTCTAAIPFAEGLTVPDNKTIVLGTNSDITIQYDESTNDSLEIAANVEGAALGIVLKADQGDDNADQHKLNIADGGVLTLGSKISGSFVNYLTHTPNSTVASSTTAVAGNLTVGGDLTLGSGAVISEAELEAIDGVTAGTVAASKAVIVDSNKDIASFRNVTLTGELDAGSLDISGDADIDGTLEADAMTLNGTAITATATLDTGISNNNVPKFTSGVADDDFLRVAGTAIEGRSASEVLSDIGAAPAAGSSNIVTTGALNSGSITSGFGSIDNGSSAITTTGTITGGVMDVDNIRIDGNTISSTNTNGNITLTPNGTGEVNLVDNDKLTFGDSDLQIYHDGSHSYVKDNGTGNLLIQGSTAIVLEDPDGNNMIYAEDGGPVYLYNNGSQKLATTSTGVDVTGTTTTDSLEVKNGTTQQLVIGNSGSYAGAEYGELLFKEGSTELARVKWNPSGNTFQLINNIAGPMTFATNGTERMRVDSSGNLLVGKTSNDSTTVGANIRADKSFFTSDGQEALVLNRNTSDGIILEFRQANATVGVISVFGADMYIGTDDAGLTFNNSADLIAPVNPTTGATRDNAIDLGATNARFDDIYATNGTIQTSDQNEKQDIASLTTAEITAAKAISKLFKTFKWQDKVAAKGDAARRHTGVIAQEVQTAMTDAGLDASNYAFWCSDTWTNDDGTSQTRLGIRYPELLAFVGAATEQRLADIETRLTALENAE